MPSPPTPVLCSRRLVHNPSNCWSAHCFLAQLSTKQWEPSSSSLHLQCQAWFQTRLQIRKSGCLQWRPASRPATSVHSAASCCSLSAKWSLLLEKENLHNPSRGKTHGSGWKGEAQDICRLVSFRLGLGSVRMLKVAVSRGSAAHFYY